MQGIPTPLDRRYIIIQIKEDRDGCQAVVPIHPSILDLPESILTDESIAREALSAAREQFETEANAYAEAMTQHGINPSLRMDEFQRINDKWRFDFAPYREMLAMRWEFEDEQPYEIGLVPAVLVSNGVFTKTSQPNQAPLEEIEIVPNVFILYGNTRASDHLLLSREMMLEYERKGELPLGLPKKLLRSERGWMVEVPMSALCSSYTLNVPQALLLRNWAVEYHNRLLQRSVSAISN